MTASSVATPLARPSGSTLVFSLRRLPLLAARLGAGLAWLWGKPLKLGSLVIAARHRDVHEVLARDLDFVIQPIYAPRFDAIGYHFILGMDRSGELDRERHSLYAALAKVDLAPVQARAGAAIAARLAGAPKALDVIEDYARPIAAGTAQALFGIAPPDEALFQDAARAVFGHCFLNLSGDKTVAARAQAGAALLTGWFDAEIARRRAANAPGDDMMGQLLAATSDDDLVRRTLGGMLVGAIDTTATAVAKILTVLMADRTLLAAARRDRADLTRLAGWCDEALRRWTQTPVLGRQAAYDTTLAGVTVPAGAKVILWTQAAMFDASAFPYPDTLRPDRDGAIYLHRGAGLHPCAGRAINAWQIPLLVAGLLDGPCTRLDPMQWAGPFPAHLVLHRDKAA